MASAATRDSQLFQSLEAIMAFMMVVIGCLLQVAIAPAAYGPMADLFAVFGIVGFVGIQLLRIQLMDKMHGTLAKRMAIILCDFGAGVVIVFGLGNWMTVVDRLLLLSVVAAGSYCGWALVGWGFRNGSSFALSKMGVGWGGMPKSFWALIMGVLEGGRDKRVRPIQFTSDVPRLARR